MHTLEKLVTASVTALRNASTRDGNRPPVSSTLLRNSSNDSGNGMSNRDVNTTVIRAGSDTFSSYRRSDGDFGIESSTVRQISSAVDNGAYGDFRRVSGNMTSSGSQKIGSMPTADNPRKFQPEPMPLKAVQGLAPEHRRINSHDR